jgi:hypothetical protein
VPGEGVIVEQDEMRVYETDALTAYKQGSSWVSGCWRRSQRVRRSDSCPVTDHVFP